MNKRNWILYPALILGGALLTMAFQNCSPTNMQKIATYSLSKDSAAGFEGELPPSTNSEPEITETDGGSTETTTTLAVTQTTLKQGEGPLPNLTPIQSSALGEWELIALTIDGEDVEVPEIDPITMKIRSVGMTDADKAKKLTDNRVLLLFHVTLREVCTPIVGNYLGITEEGVRDLAGSPLDLQGKGFRQETNNVYVRGENCSADDENKIRRKASHEVSAITKHQPDSQILTFERRGQNLVVIHSNSEMTFAPLDTP